MDASLSSILAHWNLGEVTSLAAFQSESYRCSGNVYLVQCGEYRFVLKRMENKSTLGPLFTILPELHKRGLPVAAPLRTRDSKLAVFHAGDCYYVAPFLHGSVISDHFGPGMEQRSRSFSKSLARLHVALRQIPVPRELKDMNLLVQVRACEAEARAHGMSHLTMVALNETIDALQRLAPLPTQVIHRDAHASNVLFTSNKLSGWLDFELTTIGPRLFDLCYYSTSLLMDALQEPVRSEQWFSVLRHLIAGYQEVEQLTENERVALPYVLLAIEAIFLSYYFRHNDREGVMRNTLALEWIHSQIPQIRSLMTPHPQLKESRFHGRS
jgi:Ser/Thr protein kinase RdoA (MazF antagonist)